MKEPIITTDRLTKRYKDVTAVSDVSLTVGKGEIYGFLGLNGAGKTTTIRLLLGMIRPTSGSAVINGQKVYPDNLGLWKEIGYLVEVPYSYPNLTVRENLEITRRLRQVPDRGVVGRVIGLLKLDAYAGRKAKNLSLGNAQRLGLAKALMHDPSCKYRVKIAQVHRLKTAQLSDVKISFLLMYASSFLPGKEG